MKTKLIAVILLAAGAASAIPLSEIIRVERAKLEYEAIDFQVYCINGATQTPVNVCSEKKLQLKADIEQFLGLVNEEKFGNFKSEMNKQRRFAEKLLENLQ
jgi:hypothetical protein